MITRLLLLFCFSTVLLVSCSKEGILSNFSNIYRTDSYGNLLGGDLSDGQWQNKTFNEREMALFKDLDTANLSGALKPSAINVRYALPNPFTGYVGIPITLNSDFNGLIVVKYVIVNRKMKPVQKGVQRLQAASNSYFAINPAFSAGKYRLYFTFSAEGQEHFYKSWGNIERN